MYPHSLSHTLLHKLHTELHLVRYYFPLCTILCKLIAHTHSTGTGSPEINFHKPLVRDSLTRNSSNRLEKFSLTRRRAWRTKGSFDSLSYCLEFSGDDRARELLKKSENVCLLPKLTRIHKSSFSGASASWLTSDGRLVSRRRSRPSPSSSSVAHMKKCCCRKQQQKNQPSTLTLAPFRRQKHTHFDIYNIGGDTIKECRERAVDRSKHWRIYTRARVCTTPLKRPMRSSHQSKLSVCVYWCESLRIFYPSWKAGISTGGRGVWRCSLSQLRMCERRRPRDDHRCVRAQRVCVSAARKLRWIG